MQRKIEDYYEYENNSSEQIQVKCKLCKEINVEQNHVYQECPKAIVTCPASGNNCSWIGLREELVIHLSLCSYKSSTMNSDHGEFLPFSNISFQQRHFQNQDIAIAVKALVINKRCTSLDLFNKGISAQGASIIASALSEDTSLETLSLRNNLICDSGVQFLAHALSTNAYLKRLDLNNNSITDTGVRLLAEMLKTNQSLIKLTLSFNRISNEGMDILVDVLINYNTTLRWLSLTGNVGINDKSTHSILQLIRDNHSLETLNLEECSLLWWSKKKIYFYQTIHIKSKLNLLF
jgi:hypothetical protein